ncbi:tRNA adenosine deaminase-associated protein [Sporichthya polymorpha]|uniref:tRNA adenosine deaminase-associated protein n=1 Tax=Sporichthya polymorpha TaxID=35751 RepID=UPI000360A835|nr:tRNA adenosine deaminase-associated protein [Sporichthya polymorpha]
MGYFAAVLTRTEDGWDANEIDLDEIEDLTDLADAMRESSADADPESTSLLFFEQEDAWFAVVRVDGEEDPRVFVSDSDAVGHSAYAEMLLEAAGGTGAALAVEELDVEPEDSDAVDDDADDEPEDLDAGPVGDTELLTDLGTDGETLLSLCSKEGMLPSEILTALAEAAGAGEALESVR